MSLRGLAFPAIRHAGGFFATRTAYDVAWGDLLFLILTPYGSRPGQRDFGCALHDLVMAQTTEALASLSRDYILRAVKQWAPHLKVQDVRAAVVENQLVLDIDFGLTAEESSTTRQVQVPMGDYMGNSQ